MFNLEPWELRSMEHMRAKAYGQLLDVCSLEQVLEIFKCQDWIDPRPRSANQKPFENGKWYIQCYTNALCGFLVHDICHFAEQEEERVGKWDFGGKIRFDFKTMKPLEREIRVLGYQYNLMRVLKFGGFSTQKAPLEKMAVELYRFYPQHISFEEHKRMPDLIVRLLSEAIYENTVEKFCKEFSKRVNIYRGGKFQEHLETQSV